MSRQRFSNFVETPGAADWYNNVVTAGQGCQLPDLPVREPFREDRMNDPLPRTQTTVEIVDFGVAALEIPGTSAAEITEFIYPASSVFIDIDQPDTATPAKRRGFVWRAFSAVFRFVGWTLRSLFGIASLILLLAVIAAIPVVNFLALGYLLEVEGRLGRSGKLRDAFPLIAVAPRLGSIALGIWAWIIPLRLLANVAADARLIDPGSRSDIVLHILVPALAIIVTVHLCLALARGGSLWSFMWPLTLPFVPLVAPFVVLYMVVRHRSLSWLFRPFHRFVAGFRRLTTPEYWNQASVAVHDFVADLQLKHHFLLGMKGWIGAMIWLTIPTLLFAATTKTEGGPLLVTLFGGILLMIVLTWVPFLQAHYAAENRFGAMFELRKVRQLYKNAPFSWLITMLITLTLALPMYLFKIALPPADAMAFVTIVFIVSIYPVKVITGWAYHRAVTRERRAHWSLRWLTRLGLVPLLLIFVILLFFTQFIGEHGKGVLFEHHAFLLPVPF
jgi:hypothetical protein